MPLPFKGVLHECLSNMHIQGPNGDGRRGPCGDFELNSVECLEAYGVHKGMELCQKYFEDLQECKNGRLRDMRVFLMRQERFKKIAKGEIPWSKRYGEPQPYDSYIAGTFYP